MYKVFKRAIDIIAATTGLIVTSPVLLVACIAIKLEDTKSPIFFTQKRVGYKEKRFKIYKLRTMKVNKKTGVNEVTKMGKILRSTSIDELPQLINILKGDMSLIGPRPWIEQYTDYFTAREKRRSEVLPGLSGLAQVRGRNGITIREKLEADIEYVDKQSFKLDLEIFFKTIYVVLKKTNASIKECSIQDEINYLKDKFEKESQINNTIEKDVEETNDKKEEVLVKS